MYFLKLSVPFSGNLTPWTFSYLSRHLSDVFLLT